MLEATVFTMQTDHKSLTFAFQQRSDKASARQLRQLDFIGQFSTRIVHLPGNSNTVANALSRIEEITAGTIFDNEELAVAQETPGTETVAGLRVDRTPPQTVHNSRHKQTILLRHLHRQRPPLKNSEKKFSTFSTTPHTLASNPQVEQSKKNSCGLAWTPTSICVQFC
jgi:hypothetical protein